MAAMRHSPGVILAVLALLCTGAAGGGTPPLFVLPDLVQRAPQAVDVVWGGPPGGPPRAQLTFASNVENTGWGPLVVVGQRPSIRVPTMQADQLIRRRTGGFKRIPRVGRLRYNIDPTHQHWHLKPFEQYELRTLDGQRIVRDHKSGFCLTSDHISELPTLGPRGTRLIGRNRCGLNAPKARRVVEGTAVGYGDIYPPIKEGQYLDVTGVPPGDYDLVNRVNVGRKIREVNYANDAASLRIRLLPPAVPGDPPGVIVLNTCEQGTSC
jgi:Lysyl oxidase